MNCWIYNGVTNIRSYKYCTEYISLNKWSILTGHLGYLIIYLLFRVKIVYEKILSKILLINALREVCVITCFSV